MSRVPPRPPQAPKAPASLRPPKLKGTLRLRPPRAPESVALDGQETGTGDGLPPYVEWRTFLRQFRWLQGEHLTTIGPTGSGKTVLNRQLLRLRSMVVVLGVKQRDPELYEPFLNEGYELRRTFDADWAFEQDEPSLVLYVPQTSKPVASERQKELSNRFRQALSDIYVTKAPWAVYCDDVNYLADDLKLGPDLRELWYLGRSQNITMVASSQEPVNIPIAAYGSATHLFIFKNPDLYRVKRLAMMAGANRDLVRETIIRLPRHEFLYINKDTGEMLRSKVAKRGA